MKEIDLIKELNLRLEGKRGNRIKTNQSKVDFPTTLIVGCPRSGTTALLQYLAATGSWTYPSNLITRFVGSIDIGYLVQELLYHREYGFLKDYSLENYSSMYGRTEGALNTNEFFHYWRRFFPNTEIRHLSSEELPLVKVTDYLDEISNLCDLTNKPFLAKGLMHQFNLEFMHKKMPNTIFLYIKRNVKAVMQSIYMARLSEFGDTRKWWSAKPKEYAELVNKSPEEQIAGQVYYINKAISQGMEKIPTGKKLTVHYEDFIKRPDVIYDSLSVLYKKLGVNIDTLNSYPEMGMYNSDNVLIDECVADRLSKYYLEFRNK